MSKLVFLSFFIASSFKSIVGHENKLKQDQNNSDIKAGQLHNSQMDLEDLKILEKSKIDIENPHLSGFDIPLDAFSLHHPFLQSHVQEFEYSDWYFLFLTLFYTNSSHIETVDVSILVPELTHALSSKLNVPPNYFSISKAEKYRSNSISANLSVTNHTIPHLHQKLINLHNTSPLFWLHGVRYKLVQVIHDKNHHLFVRDGKKGISNNELGLLIFVTLGGIIIFLVLLMLALLNFKLIFLKQNDPDLEEMLKDENDGDDITEIDAEEGAIFTIDRKNFEDQIEKHCDDLNNEPMLNDHFHPDPSLRQNKSRNCTKKQKVNSGIWKKLKYCKTLF